MVGPGRDQPMSKATDMIILERRCDRHRQQLGDLVANLARRIEPIQRRGPFVVRLVVEPVVDLSDLFVSFGVHEPTVAATPTAVNRATH